ncbi:MerR family transcriptional regulator [Paenibacillus zeisoli]|uniref:MerR family transcriptional regulator n=1 Tax=Paenibacillus zeisoli TaxID=2496267 RepID=A0A3S1BU13_9BACL|nr:MerR family transcriptional regulator [Paenibacillus zeisoli]RUT33357.1 MerR family transcriptional regulator [Paenibacillus zeisoli]
MKISEFIKHAGTTRDTVRHYEMLGLIKPEWVQGRRDYTDKQLSDMDAIMEMKSMGLELKEIQMIVSLKSERGCGSGALIEGVINKLTDQFTALLREEERLRQSRQAIEAVLHELRSLHAQNAKEQPTP